MNSPLLGVDIGFKRTGTALSESGIIAQPLGVIEADPPHMHRVINSLVEEVEKHSVNTLVIGMPYTEDGDPTDQSLKVEQVITLLQQTLLSKGLDPEIIQINEFYSTQEAAALYPDAELDAASAALILQEYINQQT